jgi:transcriptional regulator with PAS, ATPase and Fis domain
MQAKLLRVVQERELIRVGGSRPIKIDVRIVAATNKDLKLSMSSGAFRRDLYYRLNVVSIVMPTLSERKKDIPILARYFLERFNKRGPKNIVGFSGEALELLCSYDFPGNVRELENIVERAAALSRTEIVDVDALPDDLREMNVSSLHQDPSAVKTIDELEREHIDKVMARFGHNKTRAARALGIDRVSLYRKLKKMQLQD